MGDTHDQVTITTNGAPAAVLIGVDEWESIQEILFWLAQPGTVDSLAQAEAGVEAGDSSVRTRSAPPTGFRGDRVDVPDGDDGYTTRFTVTGKGDRDKLPPRILAAVIEFAFGDLARQPHRVGKPLARKLAGLHSARRGPYRLLYRIDYTGRIVWVHRVVHRGGVYRHPEPRGNVT